VWGSPNFFSSRKSQCRKRNIKNMPPVMSRTGADCWTEFKTKGLEDQLADKICNAFSLVLKIQTIKKGKSPRIIKTELNIPQVKNHLLARGLIVANTSAFITALSIDDTVSKRERPITIIKKDQNILIF
jgi:hypothetical protein